ncbi:MAG TPA: isochorismate synthase [Acidimicrobiia bacterium]|nr:isochorismate synthase [Acidimicrobiia bacterium]
MTLRIEPTEITIEGALARGPHTVWISPELTLAGFGQRLRLDPGVGPGRFERARWMFAEWVGDQGPIEFDGLGQGGPYAFGSFTFDEESSPSVLLIPEIVFASDGRSSWLVCHGLPHQAWGETVPGHPGAQPDRPRFAGSSLPDHLWLDAVARAIKEIGAGKLEKVVLARDHALWSKEPFDLHRVLNKLHRGFPECMVFLVDGLVGASPELLIRKVGNAVTSLALAGSARRDAEPAADRRLGLELLASQKDLHEHALASASVGRVLGEVCTSLDRPARPDLVKLANVQHLATRFAGVMAEPHHVLDLVGRLHPTAAVGGTPTAAAIDMIRSLEGMDRGRYAGPVGIFDSAGDGEFAIALRCAEVSGARARLFAGAGLVSGSVPEDELEETRIKLQAMLSALE